MPPKSNFCLSFFSGFPFFHVCCFWSSSVQKNNNSFVSVAHPTMVSKRRVFVRDLVCGGNHLHFSVFPPLRMLFFQELVEQR